MLKDSPHVPSRADVVYRRNDPREPSLYALESLPPPLHRPLPVSTEFTSYLDSLVDRFERPDFIEHDPIAIPHGFDDPRDREVIGLFAALLAWGRRRAILDKMADLCERMEYRPFRFVYDFPSGRAASALEGFMYRTFQPQDAYWFTHNLGLLLREHGTVESLFARHLTRASSDVGPAIQGFSESIMSARATTPARLQKHLARPSTGSACKRLSMYLRWMVRPGPVDFGIWPSIDRSLLILPVDVHSGRQARALGMLDRRQNDWKAALELTDRCRMLSPQDPARYDFAFFGAGAYGIELDGRFTGTRNPGSRTEPTTR